MKLKFKQQGYQTDAVNAVVDCFDGNPSGRAPLSARPGPSHGQTARLELDGASGTMTLPCRSPKLC